MNATKSPISGAWEVCDIVGGQYVRKVYYGYTKRDALRAFRALLLSLARPRSAGTFLERSQPKEHEHTFACVDPDACPETGGHITTDDCRSYGCRECR